MTEVQDILTKLAGFDTTSSKTNRALIDFARDFLDAHKIPSEPIETGDNGKACLWATLGPAETEGGLILAGHTDTVPVEGQDWASDPFILAERDGKLYARGAADMKGFIACVLAVAALHARTPLKKPVHIALTHDEETDMSGAARLIEHLKKRGIKPGWAWIGEPTGLAVVDTHKGVAAFKTDITGIAGHSGQPERGLNAISLGARFIDIIERVAEARKKNPVAGSRFAPPGTTFNLGTIHGGTAENIIAEHCEILWQVRAHPGDDLNQTLGEIDRMAGEEIAPRLRPFAPRAKMKTCTCFDIPPLLADEANPGRASLLRLTGREGAEAVSFATEGGFYQKLGCPAVICGPGHIDQAHKANEYVEKSQLAACSDLLNRALAEITA